MPPKTIIRPGRQRTGRSSASDYVKNKPKKPIHTPPVGTKNQAENQIYSKVVQGASAMVTEVPLREGGFRSNEVKMKMDNAKVMMMMWISWSKKCGSLQMLHISIQNYYQARFKYFFFWQFRFSWPSFFFRHNQWQLRIYDFK